MPTYRSVLMRALATAVMLFGLGTAANAATFTAASMTSPTPGTTLSGTTVTFKWTTGTYVSQYKLRIGSSSGATDIYNASLGRNTSAIVTNLPSDGRTLYVRLTSVSYFGYSRTASYTYTAVQTTPPPPPPPPPTSTPAAMTSPTPGSTLSGTTATFTWSSGVNVSQYSLSVGTTLGGTDIYGAGPGGNTSATVANLPNNGRTIYVRLGSLISNAWSYADYTYISGVTQTASGCDAMASGQGASLNQFVPFSASNAWNQDISAAPVDANSSAIINYIGSGIGLHADFGAGQYNSSTMGIPYQVVDSTQAMVSVVGADAGGEGDGSPMPIPATAAIEGYPNPGSGDRHVLVLERGTCWLYELYSAYVDANGNWSAAQGTVWDLLGDEKRPLTWTSADAAGLPIFPGLVRYDEVAAGKIAHALRFTLQRSRQAFVPPASHWAANSSDALAAPMGMRIRLKASFDVSKYSAANQVILNAMKKYGMIMADNGSSMFISGTPDDRWDNNDLHQLAQVTASNFEVVQMGQVYTPANLPTGAAPTISSVTASAYTVAKGTPVTLNWTATGASYVFISPQVGPVRGNSVTFTPKQSATYTIYATNQYGRRTATVTVNVQ